MVSRHFSPLSLTVPEYSSTLGEAASWATKAVSMQASNWSDSAAHAAASEAASTWVKATKGSVREGADLAKAAASHAAGAWSGEGKKVVTTAKNVTALGAARFRRSSGVGDEDDTAGDGWVTSLGTAGVVATEIGEVPPNREHAIEGSEEDLQGLTNLE